MTHTLHGAATFDWRGQQLTTGVMPYLRTLRGVERDDHLEAWGPRR